ncbi:hypothetical protein JHK87_012493 [Glycine soja]|nr:hypothetical protein JHK87_012493 [Glycine soja]
MNPICAKVQNLQTKTVNKTIKNGAREWDSVMYRSFLRCDDPKGVVECGTIRKYRTRSQKVKDKTRIQKTGENLETSLSLMNKRYKEENKVPKGCDGNLIDPSSYRDIMCDEKSKDIAEAIAPKMERPPSLIFKLMGLEEAPSKSFPSVKQKQLDRELDMLKVRKNDSIAEKQKALRETLDTTHFKGILKECFVKEPKLHVHHFNDTSSKQFGDLSHIALMKPQCTLYQESVKSTYMSVPPKELPITKLKPETAYSKTIKHRKGSSSTNMGKEMEKGICKWVSKEEGPKFVKEIMKLDAKGINPVEESSGKVKLYCHIGHTSQTNETIDKKWKVQTIGIKQLEKDISQPIIAATRPQYERGIPSTKLRKLKSGSRIDMNEISCLKRTGVNYVKALAAPLLIMGRDIRKFVAGSKHLN